MRNKTIDMNWKKERTDRNLCGYCTGSPPSANCDGSCFTRKDYTYNKICENRVKHLRDEIGKLPEQREALDAREEELRQELKNLS